jgi:hypothetical protein
MMNALNWIAIPILLSFAPARASCETSLPLKGSISVTSCDPAKEKCVSSSQAVYEYTEAYHDDSTEYSVGIPSSPWHFYDPDMRIVRVDRLADQIKSGLTPRYKYVLLISSWSGVSPDGKTASLAAQLSNKLGGFPVKGQDGFVWMTKNGKIRTTKQAATMFEGSYTKIPEGSDVFVSMVYSWPIQVEHKFMEKKDGKGLLLAGAGWDIFSLCQDKALDRFEASATLSNSIGAYNAAILLTERATHTDSTAAINFLQTAAQNGDLPSKQLLQELTKK